MKRHGNLVPNCELIYRYESKGGDRFTVKGAGINFTATGWFEKGFGSRRCGAPSS